MFAVVTFLCRRTFTHGTQSALWLHTCNLHIPGLSSKSHGRPCETLVDRTAGQSLRGQRCGGMGPMVTSAEPLQPGLHRKSCAFRHPSFPPGWRVANLCTLHRTWFDVTLACARHAGYTRSILLARSVPCHLPCVCQRKHCAMRLERIAYEYEAIAHGTGTSTLMHISAERVPNSHIPIW